MKSLLTRLPCWDLASFLIADTLISLLIVMRDVKEQKVNSTYQKGLVTSPAHIILQNQIWREVLLVALQFQKLHRKAEP